ncbi:hypothetical protein ACIRVK_44630 [Streptomyces sp. NPDC101152]|uniref:hypothetical protein n=1 Tax=Streptomyces sp. NPDC101152 TaxID=3366116 RepID=UPI00382EAB3E
MKIIRQTVTALTLTAGTLLVATPAYAAPTTLPALGLPVPPGLGLTVVAAALRTLEGVIDSLAGAVLSLIPS